jgi:polyferredoxin
MRARHLRYGLLTVVLGSVVYLAVGGGQRSFEAFCPFGGAESLWGLITAGEFSCALGPLNLSMFIAVIALALVAKKAFCGWACPIGYLGELAGRLGGVLWPKRPRMRPRHNAMLKLVRYAALGVSLYFTYRLGELILRGFDPFYTVFSGFGHGTLGWVTYAVTGVIAVGAFVVPMFFCRYLCPLGATLDPASRLGLIKVSRNDGLCTQCGDCGLACPHEIKPFEVETVRSRDCTNCLECIDACPVDGSLSLRATVWSRR